MGARHQPKDPEVVESPSKKAPRRVRRLRRTAVWVVGILAGLVFLTVLASLFVDEPLRRSMERRMNEKLTGYTVRIPGLDFRLIGLSVTLEGLTIRQDANPEPPVAYVPRLKASVHWQELLGFRLVADFLLDNPRVHINLAQLRKENRDQVPVEKRGWQDAVAEIYPLKINMLRVRDGSLTYIDQDPQRPLRLSRVRFEASNIRNIHARERDYPSPVRLEAAVLETGHGLVEGHANFLAKPHPGFHALFGLRDIPLDRFRPILGRNNLSVRGGSLSSSGKIEYSSPVKVARVEDLTIRGIRIDYLHTTKTAAAEKRRTEKVERAVKRATNKPGLLLELEKFHLANSELGLINRAKQPDYRLFIAGTDLHVTNLSNQLRRGPAKVRLTGKFMGSGATRATATFRPEKIGPDFDIDVAIEKTQMRPMNDFLRAYGKFDVVAGVFSLFTEIRVKDGGIRGYVKPLFEELDVYDRRQDKDKSVFKKLYEGVVGGIAKLLENRRDEVVTVAKLSGPVSDPKSSTWEVVVRLIQNAFFEAILPGFEQEAGKKR